MSRTLSEVTMTNKVADISASSPANTTKHGPATSIEAQMKGGEPSVTDNVGADKPDVEVNIGPAIYPPILENMEVLGYIKNENGTVYSRDIGRSALIHDEVYFIFGDTSCKESAGNSAGITSNTIAYVEHRYAPLESEYLEIFDDGKVKAFVPLSEEEIQFEKENEAARIVFRMFGGVVDTGAVGMVWFQKLIEYENGNKEYHGVGIAMLSTYSDGRILVDRIKPLLFGPNEPRIGSFSTLKYNGRVYLWGDRDGQIILARTGFYETTLRDRYEYWSGNAWVPRWHDAQPVLHGVQHGAIIETQMFGKDKPFLFVGVNDKEDSMVQIGAAADIQGPFDLTAIYKATGVDHDEGHKSCIEHRPGGVIAAKLKFKIDEVAAVKEAEERKEQKRVKEEQEARRLTSIAEMQTARDENRYDSTESDDEPTPKRGRSGLLKRAML